MGIMFRILTIFFLAVVLLIAGFIRKSRLLKITSIITFAISIGLYLIIWNALGYM